MSTAETPPGNLNVDQLLEHAKQCTGLKDFGEKEFREPLAVLVMSLDKEADLNTAGRQMHYQRILNSLKNRLRMQQWIKQNPEILAESLLPPVVIVGLTRTGTTLMHRLLACDSRFYAPLWYEVRNPAPYLDWDVQRQDQRIVEARNEVAQMLRANPQLAAIHPMDPIAADEEILLLEHSFYSYLPSAFANVPSYNHWLASNDNTPGYQYLKRQLQFLQWQKKRRAQNAERWLLKAPHHLHFMDLLLKTFPQAQIIATHRDPVVSIASTASFHYNLWLLGTDNPDKRTVAEQWMQLFAGAIKHTMAVRATQQQRFFDIWFHETATQPLAVIEKIYRFLSMPLTAEVRCAMQAHAATHKREDRPAHEYTLEEYGLTEQGIRALFSEYCKCFIHR